MFKNITFVFLLLYFLSGSISAQTPSRMDMGLVQCDALTEASGLAASLRQKNVLWTHNDSGHDSYLYAISIYGELLFTLYLASIKAVDWEDIATGPGPDPDKDYLYIGDFGDNTKTRDVKTILRFVEPDLSDNKKEKTISPPEVARIHFRYPDGMKDAESLIVDPLTKNIWVFSKEDGISCAYVLRYPYETNRINIMEKTGTIPLPLAAAADISKDGRHILVKNYFKVLYYERGHHQTIENTLKQDPAELPYIVEPQGEAICWDAAIQGYFTLSEERFKIPARLYYYPFLRDE